MDPNHLLDFVRLHTSNRLQKLPNVGGSVLDLGLKGSHDRSSETWIELGTAIEKFLGLGRVMMQRGSPVKDFALPRMLKAAHAVAGHAKGEDINPLVG